MHGDWRFHLIEMEYGIGGFFFYRMIISIVVVYICGISASNCICLHIYWISCGVHVYLAQGREVIEWVGEVKAVYCY
jgi:hypothetical protein